MVWRRKRNRLRLQVSDTHDFLGGKPHHEHYRHPARRHVAADPVHSSFGFAVKYQGISIFRGTLDDVTATLADGKLEGAAQVESISIRTPEQFRGHVLSDDFFAADKYPTVTFVAAISTCATTARRPPPAS